ncbi:hypothetical protein MTO98_09455 [Mucilaginibacter sp. SMC90]|uniref:hypothetical protein n=1 Tax=Mucilaginibacter sp. SMC90 TaxID=2929803 RepID=UPI001FB3A885|nr:hypothetical protein [Mucilaginibacter sp. SMC90]UOE51303.1 hypothetical protein MTO98_09455 [Mucilaginibacter sp. SMC90]
MGREIQALGGNLPEISATGLYDGLIDNQQDLKEKAKLFDNEWVDEVITTMDTLSRPCTIKELTELIYSNDNRYSMSTIHINVTRTIRLLNKNKLVERYNNCSQKYILRKFF